MLERLGAIQLDSVNVLVRSHYLAAVGAGSAPYDPALLDRAGVRGAARGCSSTGATRRRCLPVALQPLLRWRMAARAPSTRGAACGAIAPRARGLVGEGARRRSPSAGRSRAGDLEAGGAAEDGARVVGLVATRRRAIEWLFWSGAGHDARAGARSSGVYDLPERVLPPAVLAAPTPAEADAQRALVERAARALGVAHRGATSRDYFRLRPAPARAARSPSSSRPASCARSTVEGWRKPAYLHRDGAGAGARGPAPRGAAVAVRLADLERERTERLFGIPLPARDLHAGARAGARLLRAAVPARRRRSSRASTSRRTARRGTLRVPAAHSSRGGRAAPSPRRSRRSCAGSRRGSGSTAWRWRAGATWRARSLLS